MSRTDVLRPISEVFGNMGAQEPITEINVSGHPHTYIKGNPGQEKFVLEIKGDTWPGQISIIDVQNNIRDNHTIPYGEYDSLKIVIEKFIKYVNGEITNEKKDDDDDPITAGMFLYNAPF